MDYSSYNSTGNNLCGELMKAQFITDLRTVKKDGKWVLLEDLIYYSPTLKGNVVVHKGFATDFSSVPRWFPIIFASFGNRCHRSATIHDFLYSTGWVSRRKADKIFKEAMSVNNSIFTRYPMWLAVRLFGWMYYKKNG